MLARLDRAHRQLIDVVASLSEEEAHSERYPEKANATWRHYAVHLPELETVGTVPNS